MADLKLKGNEAFKAGNFQEAANYFTQAINVNPNDAVLYSNRSGAYASLGMYEEALADGIKCIELKPDWPKGYSRKGLAEFKLGNSAAAMETYKKGLEYDPDNEALKSAMKEVAKGDTSSAFLQTLLFVTQKIQSNPKLSKYQEEDPKYALDLAQAYSAIQSDPSAFNIYSELSPRLREGLLFCCGAEGPTESEKREAPTEEPKEPEKTEPKPSLSPSQVEANNFKEEGNKFYKQKKFAEALEMYEKAANLDPENLLIENNKAAVYLEMGEYEKCLEVCNKAIDRRYDVVADFVVVSKIYNRMAACYTKMERYDDAIAAYQKSLLEDNNRHTRTALRDLERLKDKMEREAYINPEIAEQHREKGNEYFKQFKFPEAKMEYDEAIKRNPNDPKLYSNRAAALMKLCEYPSALTDCTKALELDPQFVKAWARKGNLHMLLKEYHKAMDAFNKGLSIEKDNYECLQGKHNCYLKIQEMSQSDKVDEEQYKHAMADPEVQQILGDPQFQLILKKISENPQSMNEYMRDPMISRGIEKLIAAGMLVSDINIICRYYKNCLMEMYIQ
ncbi:conserved hypothetical protein [Theileria equi strain WA]|uniref:Hsp70-Hsp90 organising protein n=1 Tax=Theileria equi strain WA TaxID=1537102 RepID=L1LD93_THEEQ|nr:conserved hypothetical protein [Theileria equi strain WA]EKX73407.1 conserved hypothetical protein [Theileria equi strain WA]|eukprot:XP_004832859.1 conserved hypothetical protein [Theileria equi strain WA]